jgi:UDP-N-acetylmuramoyl-L-alanyl-D-glutamate--2,6-diaminopimelate ligase
VGAIPEMCISKSERQVDAVRPVRETDPRLADLLSELDGARVIGNRNLAIGNIRYDSRQVQPGDLFVAVTGRRTDGNAYAREAVDRGAVAVVTERAGLTVPPHVALVVVPNPRRGLGLLAAARMGHPSRKLGLVGVTGTDGKSTTSALVAEVLRCAGHETGLLSTVEFWVGNRRLPTHFNHTTPEAPEVQEALAEVAGSGARWAVLETSSHALALERVAGCEFDIAVLTNISPEHLDFHGTMDAYRAAKGRLFESLATGSRGGVRRFGVVNADDASAGYFKSISPVDVLTYGMEAGADVRARDVLLRSDGTEFTVDSPAGSRRLHTGLTGRFNVYNWLAAISVAVGQGIGWDAIERAVATARPVRGRMERIDEGQPFTVLVDFAHTPQALAAVLESCRVTTRGRIILVFGHPGERYAENRPRIGATAVRGSDLAIVTMDDPYGEDPGQIISQLVEGARAAGGLEGSDLLVVPDRRRAVRTAVEAAEPGDLVLIVGRGHLNYLVIGDRRLPFDDAEVARQELRRLLARAA